MAEMKFPVMTTPRGLAAYAWVHKPDDKFNSTKPWKITVVLDKNDMSSAPKPGERGARIPGAAWVKELLKMAKAAGASGKVGDSNCPVKDGDKRLDKEGKPIERFAGKLLIEFKSKHKPKLLDTRKNELPGSVKVLNGDMVRVSFRPVKGTPYQGTQFLTLYLNEVMLVQKLVEVGGDFGEEDAEDGYVVPAGAAESYDDADGDSGSDWGSDDDDDDADF